MRVTRTIKLLDLYGDEVFAAAVACETHRKRRDHPIILLPERSLHADDDVVIPHDLERYDGK